MVQFNQDQRNLAAEKLFDMANVAAGALLFGQFLADKFSLLLAAVGLAVWLGCVGCALKLLEDTEP